MIFDFQEPDTFTPNCPTQQILEVVADKWTVVILYCLAFSPKRYSEIQRRIEGISQKVLTQKLRKLERHGLIERNILTQAPPANIVYAITPLAETLIDPLLAVGDWSRKNFSAIVACRDRYDAQMRSG